jgi:hypothetical protein
VGQDVSITSKRWTAPGTAAVAGNIFLVLLIISLVLIRISIPYDPAEAGDWLSGKWRGVSLVLNLLYLAMLFTSAAVAGGLISLIVSAPQQLIESGIYSFGRGSSV